MTLVTVFLHAQNPLTTNSRDLVADILDWLTQGHTLGLENVHIDSKNHLTLRKQYAMLTLRHLQKFTVAFDTHFRI